jgi:hypothetical protein
MAPAAIGSRIADNGAVRSVRVLLSVAVILLTVGLATMWTFIARRELVSSLVEEGTAHLDQAYRAFDRFRTRSQANLQGICRILVEDPRLKATLATEGMDAATVADILNDLAKLRGAGFLMVLTPEGRVFAEAGAAGMRGLDLSESSIFKLAKDSSEALVGSWVLDNRVMDFSMTVVRYDQSIVAYVVVGHPVDEGLLKDVAELTGVEVASALADRVVLASTSDTRLMAVLARAAGQPGGFKGRVLDVEGETYVTAAVELPGTAQSHRLVFARALGRAGLDFPRLRWLISIPSLLVLISVLFAASGTRVFRRM